MLGLDPASATCYVGCCEGRKHLHSVTPCCPYLPTRPLAYSRILELLCHLALSPWARLSDLHSPRAALAFHVLAHCPVRWAAACLSQMPAAVAAPARQSLRVHPGYQINSGGITELVFKSPLLCLITAPKHRSGDIGSSDMPKRSQKALSLSAAVRFLT